jgi:MarR family transcriptional regulator, 2-MHQ and catechol-resistance regulon repressor
MSVDRREAYYHDRIRQSGPQYDGFDLASAEIFLSLRYTEDVLQQACGPFLGQYGLSKSSVNILMLLRHGPAEGMQLHDLGDLLLVSRANITGLIDHLEHKEYVTRVVDKSDRRARFARITKKGEEVLDTFVPIHYRNVRSMLRGLSETEKATLLGLLRKTRESIAAHADELERTAVAEITNAR